MMIRKNLKQVLHFEDNLIEEIVETIRIVNADKKIETKLIKDTYEQLEKLKEMQLFWDKLKSNFPEMYETMNEHCFTDHSSFEKTYCLLREKDLGIDSITPHLEKSGIDKTLYLLDRALKHPRARDIYRKMEGTTTATALSGQVFDIALSKPKARLIMQLIELWPRKEKITLTKKDPFYEYLSICLSHNGHDGLFEAANKAFIRVTQKVLSEEESQKVRIQKYLDKHSGHEIK